METTLSPGLFVRKLLRKNDSKVLRNFPFPKGFLFRFVCVSSHFVTISKCCFSWFGAYSPHSVVVVKPSANGVKHQVPPIFVYIAAKRYISGKKSEKHWFNKPAAFSGAVSVEPSSKSPRFSRMWQSPLCFSPKSFVKKRGFARVCGACAKYVSIKNKKFCS